VGSIDIAGAKMRGQNPTVTAAMAAVALLTLTVTIDAALSADAPAPAQQPAANPAATPDTPPAVTILNNHEVEGILGREVRSTADENMGRIVDVIVDRSGQVRAAIIDFGGFLGVGSRKIAVDWNALQFPAPTEAGTRITLQLTPDQVKAAPEYQEGKPVVVLGALGKLVPLPFE
jgi:PRC-barrel domain